MSVKKNGKTKNCIYIVMELLEGGSLLDMIMKTGTFSDSIARRLFKQILYAIEHMHTRGKGHRDIKPDNLVFDSNGNLKLIDFGFVCDTDNEVGGYYKDSCGTTQYMPPE